MIILYSHRLLINILPYKFHTFCGTFAKSSHIWIKMLYSKRTLTKFEIQAYNSTVFESTPPAIRTPCRIVISAPGFRPHEYWEEKSSIKQENFK